jgi:hypothetical protein
MLNIIVLYRVIQEKVHILRGDSVGQCKKNHVIMYLMLNGQRDREILIS